MAPHSIMPGSECNPSLPFGVRVDNREISFFKDLRKIRLLAAQPLGKNTELLQSLRARGEAFTKLKGTHYLEYHDYMIQRRSFGLESRILKFRVPLTPLPLPSNRDLMLL
jgi:hypothetical protein